LAASIAVYAGSRLKGINLLDDPTANAPTGEDPPP